MPTVLLPSERKPGLLRSMKPVKPLEEDSKHNRLSWANPGINCSDEIYWTGRWKEGCIELAFYHMTGEQSGHLARITFQLPTMNKNSICLHISLDIRTPEISWLY